MTNCKEKLDVEDFINIINKIRIYINDNMEYLTSLDAAIGDADHGINMARGFNEVIKRLNSLNRSATDIGTILNTVGSTLLETVGGAAGPLYGMFFMNMALVASNKREVDIDTIIAMFKNGLKGVQDIGGAVPGEKTMVDALYPAINALSNSARNILDMFQRALEEAEKGMLATKDMIARKGRASYLGERSIGHQDPGATSSYLIIKAFRDYIYENCVK
ncbi:MAG: dihydroxyacetone kinase subunit DhaL [Thermoproteus sp.]